jgi:phosphate/sulfate permease
MSSGLSVALAAFLRPLVALVLAYVLLVPVRRYVEKRMKDGKLKRLLLKRIGE